MRAMAGFRWRLGWCAGFTCALGAAIASQGCAPAARGGSGPASPPPNGAVAGAEPGRSSAGAVGVARTDARPADPDALGCVTPIEPGLGEESPWQKDLAGRLDEALAGPQPCRAGLAEGEQAALALRLVYAPDGSPTSQHVIASSPEACGAAECLKRQLGAAFAAPQPGTAGFYDVGVLLEGGQAPRRSPDPVDPLTPEREPSACTDPAVARLSRPTVSEIIGATHDELRRCYDRALGRDQSAEGSVNFEIVIGREGQVWRALARESTLYDCPAIECMLDQFRALSFPPPVGRSIRIHYPVRYAIEQAPVNLR